MSIYIDPHEIELLNSSLSLSVTKKTHNERTSSIGISSSGKTYAAGLVESDTNTFNICSEQVVLMLSAVSNDYKVNRLVTMLETTTDQNFISPLTLKIIQDHIIRTGENIEYTLVNAEGRVLKEIHKIHDLIPFYNPERISLSRTTQTNTPNYQSIKNSDEDMVEILKKFAIEGLKKNFPLYDSASGYSTAVLTKSRTIYYAGQYSNPDKRLGLHSEINAVLSAIMNKEDEITHIGLVSTKYLDSPCHMCGNCRQFLTEMTGRFNWNPKLYLFAKDNSGYTETNLTDYLPKSWESKMWKNKNASRDALT